MCKPNFLLSALFVLGLATASTAQTLPSYLPTDGLVGWWPFNGNANDESGNGNEGTLMNGVSLTDDRNGNINSAYNFDGIDDYIISNITNSNLSDQITISLWILANSNAPNEDYLIGSGNINWLVGIGANGNIPRPKVFITTTSSSTPYYGYLADDNTGDLSAGTGWHFYVITFDSNVLKIFVDNVNIKSFSINGGLILFDNIIEIGKCTCGEANFDGIIDDIGFWNRALTPQEITNLYTATPTNDGGGNNNTASANVPDGISYQAVARNAQGQPLSDAAVQVRFTLLTDSLNGSAEYSESHALTTNSLGLFTTAFGTGTPLSGTFAEINWAGGNKYLQIEIDAGNGFVDLGAQQLLSVPYALQAKKSTLIENNGLPVYSNNAAALAGGLVTGQMYRTSAGVLMVVY